MRSSGLTGFIIALLFLSDPVFAGYFKPGNNMADEQYRILYGVRIAPAKDVQLDRLSRHPMNPLRGEDREASRILIKDIKDEGLDKPILITGDYLVLRGWRRVESARKAGKKTLPAEMVAGKLDPKKDRVIITKLIFRDNNLRAGYKPEEVDEYILKIYGKERILAPLARGPKASKSENSLLPMERVVENEMGLTLGLAKFHLARIRRRIKEEAAAGARLSLTEDQERTGMSMARRWSQCQAKRERVEKTLKRLKEKSLLPLIREQKDLEKDLRKLGGKDRFLRRLK